MIDLEGEDIIPLAQAPDHLPRKAGGKKINISTIFRWTKTGIAGIRLEVAHVGNGVHTSRQALQRFVAAVTEARGGRRSATTLPTKAGERAAKALEAAGI